MSLSVPYKSAKGAQEAYLTVKKHLNPELVARFKVKAEFEYFPEEPRIKASGKGFTLTMTFEDDQASVDLDVSLILRAIKGQVLGKVEKMLLSVL